MYLKLELYFFDLIPIGSPNIKSPQPNLNICQGNSAQLVCTFNGLPVPNITWISPNGNNITDMPGFVVQFNTNSTSLTIHLVYANNSGTYNCTAANDLGESSATVQLVVIGELSYVIINL